MQKSELNLTNLKCAGCVNKIETRLNQMPGVYKAQVSLLEKKLIVEYLNQNLDTQVIEVIENMGYNATYDKLKKNTVNLYYSVGIPVLAGLLMMYFGMAKTFMPDYAALPGFIRGISESLITLLIIMFCGRDIFFHGITGFRNLSFNMHSLIFLGVSAAWLYSSGIIIINYLSDQVYIQHIYFESALIIIGLINLGAYLENKARENAANSIKALAALQPDSTTIIKNNKEKNINTNLLRRGDIVKIRVGERLPADGIITEGECFLDESMLTGESLAVNKKTGDTVIAGSISVDGAFLFSVEKVGSDTVLSEIINLVKSAQMSKPELAKIADKVTKIFVPAIILIAIITSLIWWFIGPEPRILYTFSTFMTILIISCPCSVGLAVPVALMVGLGKSAAKGILIRNPGCLSNIAKLEYVLLDKTGTITQGKPSVISLITEPGYDTDECLRLFKTLEQNSGHPLAWAILNYKPEIEPNLTVENFTVISGSGISGKINGKTYLVGTKELAGKKISSNLFVENHFTQVFLSDTNKILARIDISDTIKPDSALAIRQLQRSGVKVAMATGDNQDNANYIANLINLDKVYANCKPRDKLNIIKQLRPAIVAFVGDGINDAPGLVQADVGIAIGSGTDIAIESADIILMRDSLLGVAQAIAIGSAINRNMRQNLFGSFIYNTAAVLIAAGILYPIWHILLNPIIASAAMSLSSITVIMNALRLRRL